MSEIEWHYCNSTFEDKSQLSKHSNKVYLGSGLLEGDTLNGR
ncbi:MAG: hypothetical protein ACE5J2_00195 [Nitrososphaerales archaeon]